MIVYIVLTPSSIQCVCREEWQAKMTCFTLRNKGVPHVWYERWEVE